MRFVVLPFGVAFCHTFPHPNSWIALALTSRPALFHIPSPTPDLLAPICSAPLLLGGVDRVTFVVRAGVLLDLLGDRIEIKHESPWFF
jgi:hypothetical protein